MLRWLKIGNIPKSVIYIHTYVYRCTAINSVLEHSKIVASLLDVYTLKKELVVVVACYSRETVFRSG